MPVIPELARKHKTGGSWSRPAWKKSKTQSPKNNQRTGGLTQMVDGLPSKHKVFSPNPSTAPQKRNGQKKGIFFKVWEVQLKQ
jgi:hypothetical protein